MHLFFFFFTYFCILSTQLEQNQANSRCSVNVCRIEFSSLSEIWLKY